MIATLNVHLLVPAATAIAAGIFALLGVTRDPGGRSSRLVVLLMLAACFWSGCEAAWNLTGDRDLALQLARWASLGPIVIGPLALHLILLLEPELRERFQRTIPAVYASTGISIAVVLGSATVIPDMAKTNWGWAPVLGPGLPIVFMAVAALPGAAAWSWFRLEQRRGLSRKNSPWLELAVGIPLLMASMTNFVLPFFEIYVPRLGATCLVAWGGVTWWSAFSYRTRGLQPGQNLSPRQFAKEILQTLPDGLLLLRVDDRIRGANETMGELAGCPSDELMGRPIAEVLSDPPQAEGREFECELIVAGDNPMPVSLLKLALRDDAGDAIGSVLVVRDLREVTSLRSRLVTSGRLAAVGQLVSGIAHEINNPIAYVRSSVNLMRQHWNDLRKDFEKFDQTAGGPRSAIFAEGDELLSETADGIDRIAAIVRDVGNMRESGGAPEEDSCDLNGLLDAAVRVSAARFRGLIEIEREYGEIPILRCRSQELMQVFVNLLLNACHALEGGGTIRLTTRAEPGFAVVRIDDDGPGIDPDNLDRIFEPFYTTKPIGVGTGLGLAISKQIVENQGGHISVTSEPGQGTRFRIALRLDQQPLIDEPQS